MFINIYKQLILKTDSNLQVKFAGQTVYNALGSAGQKAKVKFDVYFTGNSQAGNYKDAKDIRTLYITTNKVLD